MTRDGEIVGYRDETGVRPLSLGGFGFDMGIIASEPVAMSVIGAISGVKYSLVRW